VNRELTVVPSKILQNKLGVLANRLQQQADPTGANPNLKTLEKTIAEAVKILSEFYRRLAEPNYRPETLVADTVPDPEQFNTNFQAIADDMEVVFAEFENLEGVILGSFNYMISRMNRLNGKMKSVYSNLGDYILYADLPTKDAIFFQDSFNDLSRIDANSTLLALEQGEINQTEGVVTLPIDHEQEAIIRVENVPVINDNSNGKVGNNEEDGAEFNGNLAVMLDNNADTWFEYERVLSTDDGEPLVLDFTITLRDAKILNFLRINPNNFGTKTQVEIANIDTSMDGSSFTSIKDDIPIAGFIVEDEENIFTLAPSTSKYAGQGLYTFTPRKVKYIRISLRQSTSYNITTSDGIEKLRYAIGIRDIEVRAIPYKEEGEIISTAFDAYDNVRKVALASNQRPDSATTSILASIEHFVSPDDGISWHPIRPLVTAGVADLLQPIPEVLDFNGIGDSSIKTTNEVYTLRYKAVLKRYPDAFVSDSPELAEKIVPATELHTVPASTPFEMVLQHRPIEDTIEVIEILLGARGRPESKYPIARGTDGPLEVRLPFKKIRRDWTTVAAHNGDEYVQYVSPFSIFVDGIEWTRGDITQPKHYRLNLNDGVLTFSDGTDGGTAVRNGAIVSATLSEERLRVGTGKYHAARLAFPTSTDKSRTEISIKHPSEMETSILEKGAVAHQLNEDIDSDVELQFSDDARDIVVSGAFAQQVDFIDGETEFVHTSGTYSVDYINGVLYCPVPTSVVQDISVTYNYFPRTVLDPDDWDFVSRKVIKSEAKGIDGILGYLEERLSRRRRRRRGPKVVLAEDEDETGNIISIKKDKFTILHADDDEFIPVGKKRFVLKYDCLIPNSLKVTDLTTGLPSTTFMKKRTRWGTHLEEISDIVKGRERMTFFEPVRGIYGDGTHWATWEEVPVYKYTMKRKPWVRDGKWAWLSHGGIFRRRRTDTITQYDQLNQLDRYYGTYTTFGMAEDSSLPTPTIYIIGPYIPWWRWYWWNRWSWYGWSNHWWWRMRHAFWKGWKRNFGTITYFWKDPRLEIDGRYAINWKTGEVDLAEPCPEDRESRYQLTYDYTSYYAKYDIGRGVSDEAWDFNSDDNAVVMKDSDKLASLAIPMTAHETAASRYYQVSYERVQEPRADVGELEQYFTPVLKDYALKVVTKSRLI
jgi:hypothetical protein